MPFTPSHAAAALPFLRTPLLPAAVVVGSMAPDIPYYVPLFVPRELSHSLLGLVTIDLAMTVVGILADGGGAGDLGPRRRRDAPAVAFVHASGLGR